MRKTHSFAVIGLAASIVLTALPAWALEPLEYVQALIRGDKKDKSAVAAFPSAHAPSIPKIDARQLQSTGAAFGPPAVAYKSETRLYISVPYRLKDGPFTQNLLFAFSRRNNEWVKRRPTPGDLVGIGTESLQIKASATASGASPNDLQRRFGGDAYFLKALAENRKDFDALAQWTERVHLIKLSTAAPDQSLDINYQLPAGGGAEFQAMVENARKLSVYIVETHTGIQFMLSPPPSGMAPYRILWLPKGLAQGEREALLDKWEQERNLTGIYEIGGWLLLRFN